MGARDGHNTSGRIANAVWPGQVKAFEQVLLPSITRGNPTAGGAKLISFDDGSVNIAQTGGSRKVEILRRERWSAGLTLRNWKAASTELARINLEEVD